MESMDIDYSSTISSIEVVGRIRRFLLISRILSDLSFFIRQSLYKVYKEGKKFSIFDMMWF